MAFWFHRGKDGELKLTSFSLSPGLLTLVAVIVALLVLYLLG